MIKINYQSINNISVLKVKKEGFSITSFIDNIKNFNPEELKSKNINSNDIFELAKYYQELEALIKEYENASIGRNKIAEEIREKLLPLQIFTSYLKKNLKDLDINYEYSETLLTNCDLALNIILKLANKNSDTFSLKRLYVNPERFFKTSKLTNSHDDNQCVWLLGNKEILDNIDDKIIYSGIDFIKILNFIMRFNSSLLIFSNNVYSSLIKPTENNSYYQYCEIKTGELNNIFCYLTDDELKDAVNKFKNFIEQNGANINGIDEDFLYEYINNSSMSLKRDKDE